MKVKNIMFSGVMAAILSATGANAAISVASQGYVDSKVGEVATSVNNYKTEVAETYATKEMINGEGGVLDTVNSLNESFVQMDGQIQDLTEIDSQLQSQIEAEEQARKEADIALQTAVDAKVAQTDYDTKVQSIEGSISTINTKLESVATTEGLAELTATVEGHTTTLESKADKTTVATDIATALGEAKTYADAAESDAVATAKAYADGLASNYDAAGSAAAVEAKLADYTKTSDLDTTFATDAELDAVDAKFANYTTTEALNTKLNDYATTTALKAEEDARKAADEIATNALANVYTKEQANEAFDAAGSADAVEAKLKLLATADVPAECQSDSSMCVLSMTANGTFAWTPLTAPLQ